MVKLFRITDEYDADLNTLRTKIRSIVSVEDTSDGSEFIIDTNVFHTVRKYEKIYGFKHVKHANTSGDVAI